MRLPVIPSRAAIRAVAGLALLAVAALAAGVPLAIVGGVAAAAMAAGFAWAIVDLRRSAQAWNAAPLHWHRQLPAAFAIGVPCTLTGTLVNDGHSAWRVELFDHVDPLFDFQGLPRSVQAPAQSRTDIRYTVVPRHRGLVRFAPAELRVRTLRGCFDWRRRAGNAQARHVYPNFAAVARYAWLAGDRRLADIGIKSVAQRGAGTDFKQLADYQAGDAIRHIDWKATLKHERPIVRQFQDERDQRVLFLLDCGRRMRADEGADAAHGSHFDEALNALMLLAHVALKQGDEVGAMTFGTDDRRRFAPRKGASTLNALMATLYDIQPEATHSDYLLAARDLMQVQHKRALVVVLTNFRDEDAPELAPALRLLRSRHLVLLASLRERVLRELAEQPLTTAAQAVEIAGAHLFAQARRDAFQRLAGHDGLLIDVEPAQLAAELVNRYRAVKRAGLL
ncbi:DUF58 domain-containing protein [Piscinibacter sp.]|uniref:DUF58 domain-containing protein n=1 Tax=Piscinibacter sp. TaxID=1903157 RepID=UPI002CF13526|nr:DUF58 domain-containing protein [Albitalea sp.]HUG23121.1 DUF58 domain-containing protein [Albitalea sp.]